MSLINQMLQDLEKRRASGAERGTLPDQVRVLPREETHSMQWWLIGIAAAVALIALLAWQFNRQPLTTTSPPVAHSPSLPAETFAVSDGPASRLALDLQQVPVPAAPVKRGAAAASDAVIPHKSALREIQAAPKEKSSPPPLATAAVVAPEPPAAKPAPAPGKAEPMKSPPSLAEISRPASAASTPAVAPIAPVKPAVTAKPVEALPDTRAQVALANPQIDKRAQTLTPQQLAENDYREAANFLNQGRLADAQESFRLALQHNPGHVGARQSLFGLLMDAKKSGEAEQLLQDGLKLNVNQPNLAVILANLQYGRGDPAGAIETMQKTAPAAATSPDYLARLAGLLQRQSRHREAIENYEAALRLAPGSGVWQMGLGISLQASNRNSEAQEAFRRAKSSNTLNPELTAFVDQRLKQLQ